MGFGSSFKKALGHAVAPVFSLPAKAVKGVTGMSPAQQLMTGAGVGAAAGMFGGMFGGGAPGAAGAGPSSAGGVMRMLGGGAGGGGLLGPLIGGAGSYFGARESADAAREANAANIGLAREQMQFSASQAEKQMKFQERMAGTAHQRAMADLKKAGLNPILAAGDGASSPGGAAGQAAGAQVAPVPSVVANTVSSALDMARSFAQVRQSLAAADNISADTVNKVAGKVKIVEEGKVASAHAEREAMRNKEIAARQAMEGLDGSNRFANWFWRWMDSVTSRLPLVNSAGKYGGN